MALGSILLWGRNLLARNVGNNDSGEPVWDLGQGNVGITASADFTPAAEAFSAGDIMGSPTVFNWTYAQTSLPIPTGSLIRVLSAVTKINVTSVPSGQTSYTLRKYSRVPPTVRVSNDPWTLAANDLTYYRGPLSLGTPVDEGACLYIKSQYIDTDIKLEDASSSTYGELVTEGAHTAAAVARSIILYGVLL